MDTVDQSRTSQPKTEGIPEPSPLGESLPVDLGEMVGLGLQGNLLVSPTPSLPRGTLVHNTRFDVDTLSAISERGLLPHEETGNKNPSTGAAVSRAVYAFEVPEEMTLEEYGRFCAQNPTRLEGISQLKSTVGQESNIYPGTFGDRKKQENAQMVAFIMDKDLIGAERAEGYSGHNGRSVAFLGSVLPEAIAGVVVGKDIADDESAVKSIISLFPGRSVFGAFGERLEV